MAGAGRVIGSLLGVIDLCFDLTLVTLLVALEHIGEGGFVFSAKDSVAMAEEGGVAGGTLREGGSRRTGENEVGGMGEGR